MRLIDADARVTVQSFDVEHEEYNYTVMSVAEALDFATDEGCPPAVDAVPVVRCKNCWKLGYDNCPMDDYFDSHPKEPDFFCAAGEPEEMRPRSACGPDYCEIGGETNADGETPLSS